MRKASLTYDTQNRTARYRAPSPSAGCGHSAPPRAAPGGPSPGRQGVPSDGRPAAVPSMIQAHDSPPRAFAELRSYTLKARRATLPCAATRCHAPRRPGQRETPDWSAGPATQCHCRALAMQTEGGTGARPWPALASRCPQSPVPGGSMGWNKNLAMFI